MAGNPYEVVGAPSYQAPDVSKFFQGGQQQGQQHTSLISALQKFLNGSGDQPPGQPLQLPSATAPGVGQSGSPYAGPVAPMNMPMINSQGLGLY